MKRIVVLTFTFLFLVSPLTISWAVDLESSGQKKVTVKSEIKRGHDAITVCSAGINFNLLGLLDCQQAVFHKNQQNNSDTPGFLLGAYFGSWMKLQMYLSVLKNAARPDDLELSGKEAISSFKKFRQLQSQLKIDDKTLVADVLQMNFPNVEKDIYLWEAKIKKGSIITIKP